VLQIRRDLNPVDYSVWGILQKKLHKRRVTDLDNLKQSTVEFLIWSLFGGQKPSYKHFPTVGAFSIACISKTTDAC